MHCLVYLFVIVESIPIPIESNYNFNYDTISNDPADWKSSEELISYFVEKEYIPQNVVFDNAECCIVAFANYFQKIEIFRYNSRFYYRRTRCRSTYLYNAPC